MSGQLNQNLKRSIGSCIAVIIGATAILAFGSQAQPDSIPGGNPGRNRLAAKDLRFSVYFRSIQPPLVTVEEGMYNIQIDASMFVDDVDFELEEEGRAVRRQERKPKGKMRHFVPVDLRPGRYVLSVKGFPDRWKSVIVVTRK